jgi:peroxiredoxin
MQRMYRTIFFLLACLSWTVAPAQKGYEIKVNIAGFQASEAYLAYYLGDKQYIKDTTTVQNGTFVFAGEEALDGGIYLVVLPPDNRYFEVIVSDDQRFSLQTDTADLVANMKIKGSTENEVFYQDLLFLAEKRKESQGFQAQGEAGKAALQALNEEVKAYRQDFMARYPDFLYTKVLRSMEDPQVPEAPAGADSLFAFYYYRNHYFDHVDFSDDRLLRTPVLFNKANTYIERLTYRHPDSIARALDLIISKSEANEEVFQFFVVHYLNQYAQSKIMGYDAIYVHLVEQYYMSGKAFWTDSATVEKMAERALALSPTLIGRAAPDFRVTDINGQPQSPHGVKADYVILYFWDYDCGHCKKITPDLAEAFLQYADYPVKLLAVSINGDDETWRKKSAEYGLNAPGIINCQDHYRRSGFDQMYDIRSTPRILLIDRNKNILAKQISVDQVEDILNREFGIKTDSGDDLEVAPATDGRK